MHEGETGALSEFYPRSAKVQRGLILLAAPSVMRIFPHKNAINASMGLSERFLSAARSF